VVRPVELIVCDVLDDHGGRKIITGGGHAGTDHRVLALQHDGIHQAHSFARLAGQDGARGLEK
jgi:hypothetical protein